MKATPWEYQFPEIANIPNLSEQLAKVREEFGEVMDAYYNEEPPERLSIELMDLISTAEQAQRILVECGVDLDAVKRDVIEKNDVRGYYGNPGKVTKLDSEARAL